MPPAAAGVVWITGLSASGKSTLAQKLVEALGAAGLDKVSLLDGEAFRQRLPRRYGHGLADRRRVMQHLVEAARSDYLDGHVVVVATISHKRDMRRGARESLPRYMEVFLDCPASACAVRDTKGHYAKAMRGEYDCFVGVTEPYEPTLPAPELVLDTQNETADTSAERLISAVQVFLGVGRRP